MVTIYLRRNHHLRFITRFLGVTALSRSKQKQSPGSIRAKLKECWVGGLMSFYPYIALMLYWGSEGSVSGFRFRFLFSFPFFCSSFY